MAIRPNLSGNYGTAQTTCSVSLRDHRMSLWSLSTGQTARQRPAPPPQPPLPPFDPSDSGGLVHTTAPPEFQPSTSPYFLRADFNGVTLQGAYQWNGQPAAPGSSITMTSGPWTGLVVPFLVGANSTPPTMIMTPMLILYPRAVQDAVLTEHAWRSYSDLIIADGAWNDTENGQAVAPAQIVDWAAYLRSWGFRVPLWSREPVVGDPYFRALLAAQAVDFFVPGEEIAGKIPAEGLLPVLDQALSDCGSGVPIGIHLAPNGPLGFPADTFLAGGQTGTWAQYNGKVHLCWESGNRTNNPSMSDPAGTMGALLYYARQMVQLGQSGDGPTTGAGAPDSRVYVWELLATSQLEGVNNGGLSVPGAPVFNELYGKLRSLEMMYCPAGLPGISMVHGFGNGASYPDGSPV